MPTVTFLSLETPKGVLRVLEGTFADGGDFDEVLGADSRVYKPDGTLLLGIRKGAVPGRRWRAAARAVTEFARPVDKLYGRKTAAGGQSNFLSGTAGFMRGKLTGATDRSGYGWDCLVKLAGRLAWASTFTLTLAGHFDAVGAIPRHARIPDTPFTTVACNRHSTSAGVTARMAYHRDRGNVPGAYGVLSVWGEFAGGLLVFPRYRVAVDLRPGDVLIADNRELHGNTAIVGTRLSVVAFAHESNV